MLRKISKNAALILCLLSFNVSSAVISLRDSKVSNFFDAVSIEIGRPVILSNKSEGFKLSGDIDISNPLSAINDVANKLNFIWYDNGYAIYIYSSSEIKNEFYSIESLDDFNQIKKHLVMTGLFDDKYELRYTQGAVFISGPPSYVSIVRDTILAYYNSLKDKKVSPDAFVVKSFRLNNRFVSDMKYIVRGNEKVIKGVASVIREIYDSGKFSAKVEIVEDYLNNTLYAKGLAKDLVDLDDIIKNVDIAREQIQISLWIIDVDSNQVNQLGTKLAGQFNSDFLDASLNATSNIILTQENSFKFVASIAALEENKKAKILSKPVLLTQNNTPAVIDTNETVYVRLLGENEVSLQAITYGTILSVSPRIKSNYSENSSEIEMMVDIEDGNQTGIDIDGIPNIRRSVISTIGRIKNNESLLLGGFIRSENSENIQGIPFLKDIPIIKYIFSYKVKNESNVMRLFLIEPKIVSDRQEFIDIEALISQTYKSLNR
ncbi:MAG: type III secretion system outer membrane ring subunit SctC [Vibrio sp.]|uniref:type III secretion system outer membrane ring subunit SctC n=1 Tax=Vibrio TaxID=662 RepID=UPI0014087FF4|nr:MULTISPECIES: type III secretion system outer membrane ring subunit SctC [unclassified Vibrio]QIL85661.1 type III secretion system outer membrane ring subunit SctC [Vibrio sp. HDW18]